MDEIEAFRAEPGEELGISWGVYRVPPHVRQNISDQLIDLAWPLAEPFSIYSAFNAVLEEHLHPNANSENRPTAGKSTADDFVAVDFAKRPHHCAERADAGYDQSVSVLGTPAVGSEFDTRAGRLKRFCCGVNVARSVIEDDH
jgi:hypothetical protein